MCCLLLYSVLQKLKTTNECIVSSLASLCSVSQEVSDHLRERERTREHMRLFACFLGMSWISAADMFVVIVVVSCCPRESESSPEEDIFTVS